MTSPTMKAMTPATKIKLAIDGQAVLVFDKRLADPVRQIAPANVAVQAKKYFPVASLRLYKASGSATTIAPMSPQRRNFW